MFNLDVFNVGYFKYYYLPQVPKPNMAINSTSRPKHKR